MDRLAAIAHSFWHLFLTLPIITQWSVAMILLCAIIAHLFTYNEQTANEAPSLFTTAGIFFTFLGIAEGLYEFQPQNIDASIPALLDGLKTAFIASVVGVGAALSIKLRYAVFGAKQRNATDKAAGTVTIDDLYHQLTEINLALSSDNSAHILTQLRQLRADSNDRLDRLNTTQLHFLEKLSEGSSKALISALQEVIRDFNLKISEQFGDNFRQLNEAVGRLLVWQEQYRAQISEMIEQQSRAANLMEESSSRYASIVENAERFSQTASSLNEILTALDSQRDQIASSLETLGKLIVNASDGLPKIESHITLLTDQIAFGVKQNQDEMTKTLRDTSAALQSSISETRNLLLDNTQLANNQLNDHIKSLADKTNEQIIKLDTALETELSKAISSLGRQLTSLSRQFVEDYTPLTERLRAIVQIGRGA